MGVKTGADGGADDGGDGGYSGAEVMELVVVVCGGEAGEMRRGR